MRDLSSLLRRIQAALGSDAELRRAVRESVEEVVGVSLSDSQFDIKDGVLSVRPSPIVKNEIKLKEVQILSAISQKAGTTVTRVVYY